MLSSPHMTLRDEGDLYRRRELGGNGSHDEVGIFDGYARFSPELQSVMESEGYHIYDPDPSGSTIASLRSAGYPFLLEWHRGNKLELIASSMCQVAIHPRQLFLEESHSKKYSVQRKMLAIFNAIVGKQFPGAAAITGNVADYSHVTFLHKDATGESLFGEQYDYCFTTTTDPNLAIGGFHEDGLRIVPIRPTEADGFLGLAPLLVPTSETGL